MKNAAPFLISFLISVLLLPSVVFAQVQTRVRIIQASNVGSTVDPSLRDVHDQLGSLFNFTSYRLLRDEQFTLSPDQSVEVPAHRNIALGIHMIRIGKRAAELRVKMRREATEILDTQVRLTPGRTVVIGGPKHGEGTIILAITARF